MIATVLSPYHSNGISRRSTVWMDWYFDEKKEINH